MTRWPKLAVYQHNLPHFGLMVTYEVLKVS